jgi:hypothetical protein
MPWRETHEQSLYCGIPCTTLLPPSSLQCGNSAINSCIRHAVSCPGLHETPALLEQIAAPVSRFHFITDYMRQRRFGDLPRLVHAAAQLRNLAPEIMHGQIG